MRYHASMSDQMKHYDVIVIGGGHAGCEAAAAARAMARPRFWLPIGWRRLVKCRAIRRLAVSARAIWCAKSTLDGLMGRVADAAGIQFRLLNRRKGPAVHGPRTQADRKLYREAMQAAIAATDNLDVLAQPVDDVLIEDGRCVGIVTADGAAFALLPWC